MRRLFLSLLIFVATLEVGLRLVTKENEVGQATISKLALLPVQPSEEGVRAWVEVRDGDGYLVLDEQLGWTHRPRGRAGDMYAADALGSRGPRDRVVTSSVPLGEVRLLGFGDSYVEGVGVPYADTWASFIEARRPEVEVLNFGVQGYGTDQACLRFEQVSEAIDADVVFLGIWPDNLYRNLNTNIFYKNPLGAGLMPKPRFLLDEDGGLRVVHQPVPAGEALVRALVDPLEHQPEVIGWEEWVEPGELVWKPWYALTTLRFTASVLSRLEKRARRRSYYADEDGAAIRLGVAIARRFAARARARGMVPFIVMFPAEDIAEHLDADGAFPPTRALRAAGLQVVDLQPAADAALAAGDSPYLESDGHLDRGGHELAAAELMKALGPALEAQRSAD